MKSHTGPYNTIWDHMEPYGTRKDKTDPAGQYVAIPVHIGPWDVTGPYWILQDHMEPYGPNGTIRDCPVPYRTIKYHMGPSELQLQVNHDEVGEGLVPDDPGEGPERQMTHDKEYLGIGVFPPPPQSQDDIHPDNTPSIGGSTSTGVTSEMVPDHLVTGEQPALLQSDESVHDITLATSADVIYEHPRGGNDDRSDMADGTTMIGMNNDAEGDDDDKVLSLTLTPSSDNNLKHSAVKQSKKTFIPVVGEGVDMKLGGDNKCGGDDDKDGRSGQQNEVVDNIAEYEGGDHDKVRCVIDKKRCMTHRCDTIPTKVSSQVWKWIVKKKEYGFVKTKTTKHICMVRIKGREVPDMTTSLEDHRLGKVAVEVGRFSVGSTQSNPETRDLRIELKSERTNLG